MFRNLVLECVRAWVARWYKAKINFHITFVGCDYIALYVLWSKWVKFEPKCANGNPVLQPRFRLLILSSAQSGRRKREEKKSIKWKCCKCFWLPFPSRLPVRPGSTYISYIFSYSLRLYRHQRFQKKHKSIKHYLPRLFYHKSLNVMLVTFRAAAFGNPHWPGLLHSSFL